MFGVSKQPKAVVLACALDADTSISVGIGTAHALRKQGIKTLMIDCIPLTGRRETVKPLYPARYDLAQVLTNEVPLEKAIVSGQANLWYSLGIRVRKAGAQKKLRTPALSVRLVEGHYELDLMLIVSNVAESRAYPFLNPDLQVIIVASPKEESLITAMDFIKSLCLNTNGKPIGVLMVGGENEQQGNSAFERLANAAMSAYAQPLEALGWAPARPEYVDPEENWESSTLTLPITLYQKLAEMTAKKIAV